MPTVSKFASYHTAISTGYTNPTNAYADDTSYATALPGKNTTVSAYFGFAAFDTSDIPDSSTINSVTLEVVWKVSTTASIATQYWQVYNNTTGVGSEQSNASEPTTDTTSTHQVTSGITLTNLRSADVVRGRLRSAQGNSSTAVTFSIDYVKLTVDYTPPSWTLTVSNGSHAHSAGSVALTQANTLAASNAAHAQSAGSPVLSQAATLVELVVEGAHHQHYVPEAPQAILIPGVGVAPEEDVLLPGGGVASRVSITLTATEPVTQAVPANAAHAVADSAPVALTQASTLSAANASHSHAAGSAALTQASTLVVAGAAHAQSAGAVALTQASTISLAPASHSHSAGAVALTQANVLSASNAVHAQTANAPVLAVAETFELVLASGLHAQAAGTVALTQASVLAGASTSHAHSVGTLSLLQAGAFQLDVANGLHAHSAGSPALVQASTISATGANHAQTAGAVSLAQASVLAAAGALHGHSAGVLSLSTGGAAPVELVVAAASHAHIAEAAVGAEVIIPGVGVVAGDEVVLPGGVLGDLAPILLGVTAGPSTLTVENSSHAQAAGAVSLTVVLSAGYTIIPGAGVVPLDEDILIPGAGMLSEGTGETVGTPTVAPAFHGHTAGSVTLDPKYQAAIAWVEYNGDVSALLVANATHSQYQWDSIKLTQANVLDVKNAQHAHFQQWAFATQSALHGHTADKPKLLVGLGVRNAVHQHTASSGNLTGLIPTLVVANASHGHTAQTTLASPTLRVANARHAPFSTNPVIIQTFVTHTLTIRDGLHAHTASGGLELDPSYRLVVADAAHGQAAGTAGLGLRLAVSNANHGVVAESAVLSPAVQLEVANAIHTHFTLPVVFTLDHWELEPADCTHDLTMEAVDLTQDNILGGLDAYHAQMVDRLWTTSTIWAEVVGRLDGWVKRPDVGNGWGPVNAAPNGWRRI